MVLRLHREPEYRPFVSLLASLVQLVERRSPKPDVGGSSPPGRVVSDSSDLRFLLQKISSKKFVDKWISTLHNGEARDTKAAQHNLGL